MIVDLPFGHPVPDGGFESFSDAVFQFLFYHLKLFIICVFLIFEKFDQIDRLIPAVICFQSLDLSGSPVRAG
jgi:hypothetical protein